MTTKTYNYGTITAPDPLCPITYSFTILYPAGPNGFASLISINPTPGISSTQGTFFISVSPSSDTSLINSSPYIITVTAALSYNSAATTTSDTLTIYVKEPCKGSTIATPATLNSVI